MSNVKLRNQALKASWVVRGYGKTHKWTKLIDAILPDNINFNYVIEGQALPVANLNIPEFYKELLHAWSLIDREDKSLNIWLNNSIQIKKKSIFTTHIYVV